jgi:hypothetical protein
MKERKGKFTSMIHITIAMGCDERQREREKTRRRKKRASE